MGRIMFFTSPTCGRCKNVKKQIETLKATEHFDMVDITSDRGDTLRETYNVTSLPTLILIENGKAKSRIETVILPKDLKQMIETAKE